MNASKIFVGNLDFGVEESELRELFAPFGCVQGINIRKDRRTGRPRGFAFVTFDEPASAAAAIEAMHLKEHRGRPLTVKSQLARGTAPAPLSAPSLFHSTSAAGEHSLRSAEQPPSGDRSSPTSRHETGSLQKAKKKSKTKKNLLFFAAGSGSSSDDSDSSSAGSEDEEDGHDVLSTQTSAAPSRALSQNDALVAKASAREVLRNHFERGYSVLRSTNAAEANDSIEAIFQVEFHQEFLAPFPRHFLSIDPAQESCPDSRTAFFKADQVPESVSKFWSEKRVTVTSTDTATLVPAPFKSFETAILPKSFCALLKQQFKAPSPIQAQGWPMLLSGCNLIGVADTGSGKTLAFLLPAFVHLLLSPLHRAKCRGIFVPTPGASVGAKSASPLCGPIAVVMAPTRELASQIHSTAAKFVDERARWLLQHQADEVWMGKWQTHVARCPPGVSGIRVGLVCGGGQRNLQLRQCRAGLDLLVATPGRLLDFMQSGHTRLYTRTTLFILDEADRMLDLGFAPYIRSVLSHVRPDCQKALFSATWPPEVEALSVQMMREHGGMLPQDDNNSQPLAVPMLQKLQIGSTQLSTSHSVEQLFCFPGDDLQKTQLLRKYISQTPGGAERVLVFVSRKDTCKELKSELCEMFERRADAGEIACIHGDLNQVDRTAALQRFKSGTVKVLVATDVASRGLDVSGLERVINYDFPYTIEDYVHRIGRTGRAGKTGQSVSFFTGHDANHSHELVALLREAGQQIPPQLAKFAAQPKKRTSRERWRWVMQKGKRAKGKSKSGYGVGAVGDTKQTKKKRDIGCFRCGQPGHQKNECPVPAAGGKGGSAPRSSKGKASTVRGPGPSGGRGRGGGRGGKKYVYDPAGRGRGRARDSGRGRGRGRGRGCGRGGPGGPAAPSKRKMATDHEQSKRPAL